MKLERIPASACFWSEDSAWGKFCCLFWMALWSLRAWDAQIQASVVTWFGQEVTPQICDLAERWHGWDLEDAGSDLSDWAESRASHPLWGEHAHTRWAPTVSCFPLSHFIYPTDSGNSTVSSHLLNYWGDLSGQVSLCCGSQFTFLCLLSWFHPLSKSVGGFFLIFF